MSNWFSRYFKPASTKSAEQLMREFARGGNLALLDELLKRHGDDLYHFLLGQADPAQAADISQSTWLKVIDKREYYQDKGSFKSWLFSLGRNLLVDQMRQNHHWQAVESDNDEPQGCSLEQQLQASQELDRFNQLLDSLPLLQKEAFMLQQEGFSLAQIAQITGENQQTVKSRLRYAKNRFKPLFTQAQEEAS